MRYRGYTIKPVTGKRIGKGEVRIFSRGHEVDTFSTVKVAQHKINFHLLKWADYYPNR